MKIRLNVIVALFLLSSPAFASRDFTSASSQRIDYNTTLGNFQRTDTFSIAFMYNAKSNNAGTVFSKYDVTGVARGWEVFLRNGTSTPTVALELVNVNATSKAATHTTSEFSLSAWHKVVITYDGMSATAGIIIYVDSTTPQGKTDIQDNLAGTILNSITSQSGARNGTSAPAQFLNGILRRFCLYNLVLSAQDISDFMAAAPNDKVPYGSATASSAPDKTKLLLWQEFSSFYDGVLQVPDWSGNGNTGFVTGAIYSATDPTVTSLLPYVGTTGVSTLSGPLTKSVATLCANPCLQNLGWVGGANSGLSDQIGPGPMQKRGPGDYRGFIENAHNVQTLDVPNQGGSNNDTPTIYGTSTDGNTWVFPTQDDSANALFSVNNIGANLTAPQLTTFKAAAHAETSIGTEFYDPDDNVEKAWFHAGNNTVGARRIYYATCPASCGVAGNWSTQNTGLPVVDVGAGGSWEESIVTDARVVRVNSSLMLMIYSGRTSAGLAQLGLASSTNRGLTWNKYSGNPFITVAAGTWKSTSVWPPAFAYDAPTSTFVVWYGGGSSVGGQDAIGFCSFTSTAPTSCTDGLFNPVATKNTVTSGTNAFEVNYASTINGYLDGARYRLLIKADNTVSGATGFRGRLEATMNQFITGGGGLLTMGVQ